ncbi:MAG: tRNA lysidine(34) synthetase TilS [Sarcina sp.]
MKNKVLNYINENSMIKDGDRVLVALSGGPDSVCLLHLLHNLKKNINMEIFAAHVNHMIRGEEAFLDEFYAKKLCENLNIKFFSKQIYVEEIAKDKGISTEMAGRDERYKFFNEIKEKENIDKIAIAHNANDQAETLIMRIMRGTGLEGLVGIKPVRDEIYIRPILSLTREEIENYCEINNLNPRIDKTNLEDIYSRNKIRLKAIPFIKENFNTDIIGTLNRLSHSASIDASFINEMVDKSYLIYCKEDNSKIVIKSNAFSENEAILTRVIRRALMNVANVHNNFELKHIYDIIRLKQGITGKKISLTNNISAFNNYGDIIISTNDYMKEDNTNQLIKLNIDDLIKREKIEIDFNVYKLKLEIVNNNGKLDFSKQNEKYFSFEAINTITIRKRKNGDKLTPFGFRGTKKLKDILISYKIPVTQRDNIPIIDFDGEIAWVVGVRSSETFRITKQNSKLLKISFSRKE